jgi:uncharacterized protein (DUF2147 family)
MPAKSINMKKIVFLAALGAGLAASPTPALAKAPIEGRWVNPKRSVTVSIAACGQAYCGTVVEASAKAKASARKGGTANLVGTQVMSDLRPKGNGTYTGRAFDPKRNIRAPATIRLTGASTLVVRGCLIKGVICKEQRWTKIG